MIYRKNDFFNFLIEWALDLSLNISKELIDDKRERVKLEKELESFSKKQLPIIVENMNNSSEFDIKLLENFSENILLDATIIYIREISPQKKKSHLNDIMSRISEFCDANYFQQKHLLQGFVKQSLNIVNCFYEKKIKNEDYVLAASTAQNILDPLLDETEEIKSNLNDLTNKMEIPRIQASLNLPQVPTTGKIIGRESDFNKIDTFLQNDKPIIIYGMGGIGKTKLAKSYLHKLKKRETSWFEWKDSIKNTLLQTLDLVKNSSFVLEQEELRLAEITGFLKELVSNTVICFDNVEHLENDDVNLILSLKCKVIITTRNYYNHLINSFNLYDIRLLPNDECKELFEYFYGSKITDIDALDRLIRKSGRHSLAIELLAKTCKAARLQVKELLEELENNGFDLSNVLESVRQDERNDDLRFVEHFSKLFDLTNISQLIINHDKAMDVLKNLCILQPIELDITVLKEWINLHSYTILNKLAEYGWLEVTENDLVNMHAVIVGTLHYKLKPHMSDCKNMITKVTKAIAFDNYDKNVYACPYLEYAENIMNYFKDLQCLEMDDIINCVAFIYSKKAKYKLSNELYKKSLLFEEVEFGKEHPSTATTYHNIAGVYYSQGDYPRALEWYGKALKIRKKILGKEHPDTTTTYNNIAGVYYCQGDYPRALEWYGKALKICEKVLGKEHPSTATTYHNIAMVYESQGDYPRALEWYGKALEIREKVLGKEHPDTASTYNNIAGVYYYAQGDYPRALEWYGKALKIYEKVLGNEHPSTANTYNNIAVVYKSQGDYSKALEWYGKALKICEKVLGKEHPSTANTYNNIAGVYDYAQGDYPRALEWYGKALKIREKVLGKEHPSTANTYNNIAGVYKSQGDYPKALEWYGKALKIREKVLGKEHPSTATTYHNIAMVYESQGDYPRALEWYGKALKICEKVLGKEHPSTATTYHNIAGVYKNQGDYPRALEWYGKALEISEKVLGKEHPSTATTYHNIALVYKNQGDYPRALEWYGKALEISEKVLGKEHPDTATTYNNIAGVYDSQGDYPRALEWYGKALEISEKVLGKEHPSTATTYNNIAWVYYAQGDYSKALDNYRMAYTIYDDKLGEQHPNTIIIKNNMKLAYERSENLMNFEEWVSKI